MPSSSTSGGGSAVGNPKVITAEGRERHRMATTYIGGAVVIILTLAYVYTLLWRPGGEARDLLPFLTGAVGLLFGRGHQGGE